MVYTLLEIVKELMHSYTENNCILVIGEQKQIQMQNITMETQILEDLVRGGKKK